MGTDFLRYENPVEIRGDAGTRDTAVLNPHGAVGDQKEPVAFRESLYQILRAGDKYVPFRKPTLVKGGDILRRKVQTDFGQKPAESFDFHLAAGDLSPLKPLPLLFVKLAVPRKHPPVRVVTETDQCLANRGSLRGVEIENRVV